jgi:hypothetical protein
MTSYELLGQVERLVTDAGREDMREANRGTAAVCLVGIGRIEEAAVILRSLASECASEARALEWRTLADALSPPRR